MSIEEFHDDAARAAAALIEWCRRQAGGAGNGHIDENERFVVKALLGEFDRANALDALMEHTGAGAGQETLRFVYRNYRGEVDIREVRTPIVVYQGATEWHPERQWLVKAWDIAKGAYRDFAYAEMRMLDDLFPGERP